MEGNYYIPKETIEKLKELNLFESLRKIPNNLQDLKGNKQGFWENYWSNGNLDSKLFFIDDKIDCEYETFNEEGQLYNRGLVVEGKRQGLWSHHWLNGNIRGIGNYLDNLKHGLWVNFSEKTKDLLENRGHFYKGKKNGEWTYYFENGEVYVKCNYDYGVLHGEYIEYKENGEIFTHEFYEKGLSVKKIH